MSISNNNRTQEEFETPKEENSNQQLDNIIKTGSVVTKNSKESIHCLNIIGQIEGHYILDNNQKTTKYEHIIPLLVAVEENEDIDGLLIVLNTMGGDVEAGLALAEMIATMSKPTVSLVLGGGHSIGIPLAVSAKRSFIVPSATMTLHPVRTSGLVIGVPQTFYYFNRMQERILDFIVSHSRANKEKLRSMMMNTAEIANDIGTILDGEKAVECGLIDEMGGVSAALAALRGMIPKKEEKIPSDIESVKENQDKQHQIESILTH
ncbi:MAG: hypothetical protein GX303_01580 [Clostridiales bacterium]|nr:hypothetical protein [Clostridiales bacterium]